MAFKKRKVDLSQQLRQTPELAEMLKAAERKRLAGEAAQLEKDMQALKDKITAATEEIEGQGS